MEPLGCVSFFSFVAYMLWWGSLLGQSADLNATSYLLRYDNLVYGFRGCACDLTVGCDLDCCCDPSCAEARILFKNQCVDEAGLSPNEHSCDYLTQESPLEGASPANDLLPLACVEKDNNALIGLFHGVRAPVSSSADFEATSAQPEAFSISTTKETISSYVIGVDVQAVDATTGVRGSLTLPSIAPHGQCIQDGGVPFLEPRDSRCSRTVSLMDCQRGSVLDLSLYIPSTLRILSAPTGASLALVSPNISLSCIGQSQCGAEPLYNASSGTCSGALQALALTIVWRAQTIVAVNGNAELTSLTLNSAQNLFSQEFSVKFIHVSQHSTTPPIARSGAYGYTPGLPLLFSKNATNASLTSLSYFLTGDSSGLCVPSSLPILFGEEGQGGCFYPLTLSSFENCTLLSSSLSNLLTAGLSFGEYTHVAMLGRRDELTSEDFVPIFFETINATMPQDQNVTFQCSMMPTGITLDVLVGAIGYSSRPQKVVLGTRLTTQMSTLTYSSSLTRLLLSMRVNYVEVPGQIAAGISTRAPSHTPKCKDGRCLHEIFYPVLEETYFDPSQSNADYFHQQAVAYVLWLGLLVLLCAALEYKFQASL